MTSIGNMLSEGLGISLVVFLPLLGALIILFIPKTQDFLIKIVTLASATVTFLLSLVG